MLYVYILTGSTNGLIAVRPRDQPREDLTHPMDKELS